MTGLLAFLAAILPMLAPFLQTLLVKPKAQAAADLREAANAHKAERQVVYAYYFSRAACAVDAMPDEEWAGMPAAFQTAKRGAMAFAAANPAQGGAA